MQDKDRALVEAEKSTVGWILEWAGEKKSYYVSSVVLAVFNVAFKIAQYFLFPPAALIRLRSQYWQL